jgi:hypothetical protein
MLGGSFDGFWLDSMSVGATFTGGAVLLFATPVVVGGNCLRHAP